MSTLPEPLAKELFPRFAVELDWLNAELELADHSVGFSNAVRLAMGMVSGRFTARGISAAPEIRGTFDFCRRLSEFGFVSWLTS